MTVSDAEALAGELAQFPFRLDLRKHALAGDGLQVIDADDRLVMLIYPDKLGRYDHAASIVDGLNAALRTPIPVAVSRVAADAQIISALEWSLEWMRKHNVDGLSPFKDYPPVKDTIAGMYSAMIAELSLPAVAVSRETDQAPEPCADLSIRELIEWLANPQYTNGFLDFDAAKYMTSAAELIERSLSLPAVAVSREEGLDHLCAGITDANRHPEIPLSRVPTDHGVGTADAAPDPFLVASHNSGERDPSVMPDWDRSGVSAVSREGVARILVETLLPSTDADGTPIINGINAATSAILQLHDRAARVGK